MNQHTGAGPVVRRRRCATLPNMDATTDTDPTETEQRYLNADSQDELDGLLLSALYSIASLPRGPLSQDWQASLWRVTAEHVRAHRIARERIGRPVQVDTDTGTIG